MNENSKIVKMIKNKLEEKMGASAMDINVEYQNGFVRLSGFVDVLAEKTFTEEIVGTIDGIKDIENNITICMDGEVTDSHITAEIDRNFKQSKISNHLKKVSTKVCGGSAVLRGSVNTLGDELRAIELAKQARGVKDVVSNLDILSSRRYDDATLKSKINQIFSNTHDIDLSVNKGKVTLKGHVKNAGDMEAAIELAADVEGVTHVTNQLKVRKKDH